MEWTNEACSTTGRSPRSGGCSFDTIPDGCLDAGASVVLPSICNGYLSILEEFGNGDLQK